MSHRFSPPVPAVCAALFGDRIGDSREDDAGSTCELSRSATEGLVDGAATDSIATRESCCLGDAVFSRMPNWVVPGFMLS